MLYGERITITPIYLTFKVPVCNIATRLEFLSPLFQILLPEFLASLSIGADFVTPLDRSALRSRT